MVGSINPVRVEDDSTRHTPHRRLRTRLRPWLPLAGVLALAAGSGLVTGQIAPLGPVTTVGALAVMATGALLGLVGGRVARSAWVVIAVAVVHVGAIEIARSDVLLPTVHDVRIDSMWGWLALVLGRGVHAALLVLPMILGARVGAGVRGRAGTAVAGVLTLGLAVVVALPASTPPVRDADGDVVPGSVATLDTVPLGGDPHTVMVRAADPDAPVLLYLSGGPGQSDLALSRVLSEPWVDDVVFATYDQRGNGTSYAALLPTEEATLDRAVTDVIELTDYLRTRFGEDRVILMGESWGTILGVLAVQQRPDLFHAYLGSGQMVDVTETDRRIYRDLVDYADRTGDGSVAALTERIGPPPYADIPWANADVMLAYEYLYGPYTPSAGYLERGRASGLDQFGVRGVEYTWVDKVDVLRGLMDTFAVMYPQIQGLDLRRDVPRLEVPVFVLDGAAELDGRRELALQWYAALEAPTKQLVTFDGAAHAVAFEQADAVERLLVEEVLPLVGDR
ncbi:alpha/beta hydrolase [uncultured Cellulomonas sp.]|uniref:alpha/beta fold hydrolase n=1 Tax=uncultured Cellulomonas sp. TaxID=189682 RepID=UPI0028F003C4|nr:alpha/beta hydrolase [uncultured Cellulomonas sp.]